MPNVCFRTLALCGLLTAPFLAAQRLAAAPPESPRPNVAAADPAAPPAADSVKEVQPPVLYLRGKDGGLLQAVLGFTLEDFERLRAQQSQPGANQQPPRVQCDRIVCHGKASGDRADLTIEITAVVNAADWVRLPLRMPTAVLRGAARYEGPGTHVVEFDPAAREYVAWLRGQSDKPHTLTLDISVPLEKVGDQTELKLDFPRAAVSELTLAVPEQNAVPKTHEGSIVDRVKRLRNGTEFHVLGLERDFSLSWRRKQADNGDVAQPLDVAGTIEARVDGSAVHSLMTLAVRGFSTKLDSFRMRIPLGATLSAEEQPDYSIELVDESTPEAEMPKGALYLVRMREKSPGPLVVRFALDRPHVDKDGVRRFEVGGVEVLGAARPWGHVAMVVGNDWQIRFDQLQNARQIDDLPADLHGPDVYAGFEYDGQPFAIGGEISPQQSHVTVEPTYTVEVDSQQLRLQARLKYMVRGAKAFAVECALPGWELDDVSPRSLFDVDRVAIDADRPLRVPLLRPSTGEFQLVLRAHRDLPAGASRVEFDLPRPKADTIAPALAVVAPAPNVALVFDEQSLNGLARVPSAGVPALPLADRARQVVLRSIAPESRFAADLRVQSQFVSAKVATAVELADRGGSVSQTIDYQIANEPVGELLLEVPLWLSNSERLQFAVDGEAVTPLYRGGDENDEAIEQVRLPLDERREGQCRLTVQYTFDAEPLESGASSLVRVPLIMPAAAEVTHNELVVTAAAGMIVRSAEEVFHAPPGGENGAEDAPLRLTADGPTPDAALQVRMADRRRFDPTIVERLWIQSRLSNGERWDRAVFQFTTGDSRVTLHLPIGASEAEARAVLDGVALAPRIASQREALSFELPASRRRHVLDVSFRYAARFDDGARLRLEAPRLGDNLWVRQTYWQLILPRDQHLVDWPTDLSGVFAWGFRGGTWGRQPLVEQPQLEAWVDAVHGIDAPPESNRYVFTSLGAIPELNVATARRSTLVIAGAGAALAIGLSLLYIPALRQPRLLLLPGILLLAAALLYPEPTVLLVQFSVVGAGLVLVAFVLDRLLNKRRRRPLVLRSGSSSVLDLGSTRTHQSGPSGSGIRSPGDSAGGDVTPLVSQSTSSAGN